MTIFFRNLANVTKDDTPSSLLAQVNDAFYQPDNVQDETLDEWLEWASDYVNILKKENIDTEERKAQMNATNPKYVFRNYMAQLAIDKANDGDYTLIEEFMKLLKQPYSEQPEHQKWFAKRPEWARNKVGCSKLSCSS